ncbi:TPA: hypothetical protein PBS81_000435 [Staphylococcus aureus]|nr:hypothetical protein [Staphylococcus aureus]HDG8586340.1 hypothetical protein [Staphylococcus aureus]HDZ3299640.1 hypothetical protein [Staphylococcus aureus]HDZ3315310.1 hypothetical protein [Staphylococcus aureus]HDZ3339921.1 hypothetical protein [Staphylococcus aureus]
MITIIINIAHLYAIIWKLKRLQKIVTSFITKHESSSIGLMENYF